MLYLRNTNQQQSLTQQAGVARGNAPERAWSEVSASYLANTFTTGALQILNDNVVISTLSASGSTFNARISASNVAGVILSGSTTALTGSFTMSLIINSNDYNYTNIVYSPGAMETSFTVASGSVYDITGSLTYTDGVNPFTTCSFYFVKSGDLDTSTTASYIACGETGSTNLYFSSSFTTASLGCVLNNTVSWTPTGSVTQFAQIWRSPYGCGFEFPTGSDSRNVTFIAPIIGQEPRDDNWYLASYVPKGSNQYQFSIVQPGQSITVCTQDTASVFFSPGQDYPFAKDYISYGGSC